MPKILDDEKIYQAVINTISKHGYIGSTTKQLAEAAGISEVTLFRKYGSKLQLVKHAIAYIIRQTELDNPDKAPLYTGDVTADLVRMVRIFQDSAMKHGDFILVLYVEMFRDPELATFVRERLHLSQVFAEVLQQYQHKGILQKEDPFQAVAALLGPLIYATLMPKIIPNKTLHLDDPEKYVHTFLHGRLVKNRK